jgi:hypothetical protein
MRHNRKHILFCLLICNVTLAYRKTIPLKKINWTPTKIAIMAAATAGSAATGFVVGAVAGLDDLNRKNFNSYYIIVGIGTVAIGTLGAILTREIIGATEDNPPAPDNSENKQSDDSKHTNKS